MAHLANVEYALPQSEPTSSAAWTGPSPVAGRGGGGADVAGVPGLSVVSDVESSLAARAMAGDEAALQTVWTANRRWVAAILLAHKPRWADVEDLLQDVGATLVRKVCELREPGALRPWLRTVAINTARAAARDGGKHARAGGLPVDEVGERSIAGRPGSGANTADGVPGPDIHDEASRLMSLAMQLPEGYREPLLLRCLKDLSYRQIGELMGLPESTIETRIARGRRMLRELALNPVDVGGVGREGAVQTVR